MLTVDRGPAHLPGRATGAVTAMKARELGRKGVVVGDRVGLVGDLSGEPDTLARIVRVEERTSVLRRTADDTTRTSGSSSPTPTSWPSSPRWPTPSRGPG